MTNRTNEIESVAVELGYTESMECSALDYIIETAKASVMVNQKNVGLVAQVEASKGLLKQCANLINVDAGNAIDWLIENSYDLGKAAKSTPTQCLNQIKAEAGRSGYQACVDAVHSAAINSYENGDSTLLGHINDLQSLSTVLDADQYAASIAKGDL